MWVLKIFIWLISVALMGTYVGYAVADSAVSKITGSLPRNAHIRQSDLGQPGQADIVRSIRVVFATSDDQIDFARIKLTIDTMVDRDIDITANLARINDMERRIRTMFPPNATSAQKLAAMRAFIYESGPWNDHRPFRYDMDDPLGTKLSNKLLPNYIESRLGNCMSMPVLFLILAQRLGLDVTLSTAPLHVFVKFRDDVTDTTYNLETTSGALPARDAYYRETIPMTDEAIANGVYMQALTKKQSIAVIATLLMEHALEQGRFETAIAVADLILEEYPTYVYAMLKKGSAFYKLLRRDFLARYRSPDAIPSDQRAHFDYLSRNNRLAFNQAEALGWREQPK